MIDAPTLDRLVLRMLDGIESDDLDVERLIRMGAHGESSVTRAERRCGVGRGRLGKRFAQHGVPAPRVLLAWGRLLTAMDAWEPTPNGGKGAECSLEAVAFRHGWSSQSSISSALWTVAGVYPRSYLMRGGTLDLLVDLFLARWRARAPERARRKREKRHQRHQRRAAA